MATLEALTLSMISDIGLEWWARYDFDERALTTQENIDTLYIPETMGTRYRITKTRVLDRLKSNQNSFRLPTNGAGCRSFSLLFAPVLLASLPEEANEASRQASKRAREVSSNLSKESKETSNAGYRKCAEKFIDVLDVNRPKGWTMGNWDVDRDPAPFVQGADPQVVKNLKLELAKQQTLLQTAKAEVAKLKDAQQRVTKHKEEAKTELSKLPKTTTIDNVVQILVRLGILPFGFWKK